VKNKQIKIAVFFLLTCLNTVYAKAREWEVLEVGMPFPVYNGESILYNSRIYILGGYNPATKMPTDTIQVFDPVSKTWEYAGKMSSKRAGFVADLYNNSFIIYGGTTGDTSKIEGIEIWDSVGTPDIIGLSDTTNRINSTGGIYNDCMYIFGGYTGITLNDSAAPYILEFSIPESRISYTYDNTVYDGQLLYQELSALYDDSYYLFGGVFFGVSKKINYFNITNKIYERIRPDLFEARAGGKAITAQNNEIFIIGGFNEAQNALATTEIFTIIEKGQQYQISPGPALNYARKQFMAELFDDYIYVFGGLDENDKIVPYIERLPVIESSTPVNNEKDECSSKKQGVSNHYLLSNYPNPFNAATTISIHLEDESLLNLDIYSVQGRKIKTLVNNMLPPGNYQFHWDGTDEKNNPVASNLYFCKLTTRDNTEFIKMLLIK